jgi:hypothetical protein
MPTSAIHRKAIYLSTLTGDSLDMPGDRWDLVHSKSSWDNAILTMFSESWRSTIVILPRKRYQNISRKTSVYFSKNLSNYARTIPPTSREKMKVSQHDKAV